MVIKKINVRDVNDNHLFFWRLHVNCDLMSNNTRIDVPSVVNVVAAATAAPPSPVGGGGVSS